MSVNGRPFGARRAGPCPAAHLCRHGGRIAVGDEVKPAVNGIGWIHEDDVAPAQIGREPIVPQSDIAIARAAEADRLLDEYDNAREADRMARLAIIPTGNYTVRPADERDAVVLSFGDADFGDFPRGTHKVAVHGSFSILVRGLSEHRSWYGFAVVKPGGRISLYKNARAILDTKPDALRPEDVHLQAKLRLAIKALRLLIDAGEAEIMRYGKAYASAANACFRCERPLTDEISQKIGLGPHCRQIVQLEIEQGGRR